MHGNPASVKSEPATASPKSDTYSPAQIHAAAVAAHKAGICVLPPRQDHTKAPLAPGGTWEQFQRRQSTLEEIEQWYARDYMVGIGYVGGAVSGNLVLLDFDVWGIYKQFLKRTRETGLYPLIKRIQEGCFDITPKPGAHLYLRTPEPVACEPTLAQRPEYNEKGELVRRHVLIETKAEGGYMIAAPSSGRIHPSGRPYRPLRGGVDSIVSVTQEEYNDILDLARSFDEMPIEQYAPTTPPRRPRGSEGLTPWDDYNQRIDFIAYIRDKGWSVNAVRGEKVELRRPDKSVGVSATWNHQGCRLFYVFSTSTPLPAMKAYTPSAVRAILDFGSNFSDCARALFSEGFGEHKGRRRTHTYDQVARAASNGVNGQTVTAVAVGGPSGGPTAGPIGGGDGQPPKEQAAEGADDRPYIIESTEEHETVKQVIDALAKDSTLYQSKEMLVSVRHDVSLKKESVPLGTPTICEVPKPVLRVRLTKVGRWVRERVTKEGEVLYVDAHPAAWAIDAVHSLGEWPGIRHLRAVLGTPTMRLDGSILDTPGYDEATGILYEPVADYPPVPSAPTREQCAEAAKRILETVSDFCFEPIDEDGGATYLHAWLAGLLTAIVHPALPLPRKVPMFNFDAPIRGAGKTKLCDLISIIACGHAMPKTGFTDDEEELDNRLVSFARAGRRLMAFDDVGIGTTIHNPALNRVLTGGTIAARLFHKQDIPEYPFDTVLFMTGNNTSLSTELARRVVPCRLTSTYERPEERDDFKVKGDLLEHVAKRRASLAVDALTIVHGYTVAGRPKPEGLTPMDFKDWCETVRYAVHWATGVDPCRGRRVLAEADLEAAERTVVKLGLYALCHAEGGRALASGQIRQAFERRGEYRSNEDAEPDEHAEAIEAFRSVVLGWSENEKLPSTQVIGSRLGAMKGAAGGGGTIQAVMSRGAQKWYVKRG